MKNLIKLKSFKNSAFLLLAIGMSPTGATTVVCSLFRSCCLPGRQTPVQPGPTGSVQPPVSQRLPNMVSSASQYSDELSGSLVSTSLGYTSSEQSADESAN